MTDDDGRVHYVTIRPEDVTIELLDVNSGNQETLTENAALALADDLIAAVRATRMIQSTGLARAETIEELASPDRAPKTPARARGSRP